MKRWLIFPVLLLAALSFAAAGAAHSGHGKPPKPNKHKQTRFTFTMANTDNGSCSIEWATEQEKRTFIVKPNHDGTFRVWRRDRGVFTTTGPGSPGACETTKPHGTLVGPGVVGKFHGYLVGVVSGGTYDPNATCSTDCGATDVFISTHFGSSATFSCFDNSPKCRFNFEYSSPNKTLALHHWRDAGRGAGTMLKEKFKGDISTDKVS